VVCKINTLHQNQKKQQSELCDYQESKNSVIYLVTLIM